MEPVQYKGYTILIKHYEAFRHCHRDYPEIFDYIIFEGKEKRRSESVCRGYDCTSAEEARIKAKKFIDEEFLEIN